MLFLTIILLAIMEVSLSFDNAVINASVLKNMPLVWQQRFLTWGVAIAVFGMRLIFPIVIVAIASGLSIPEIVNMALYTPLEYGQHLASSQKIIDAFGGMFLLMVFMSFHCDNEKEIHWLPCERFFAWLGKIDWFAAIAAFMGCIALLSATESKVIFGAALIGVATNMMLGSFKDRMEGANRPSGLWGFLYLEVLDASCSLDGVIAAFVLTNDIWLIMAGLGIGAFAIRYLTLRLVRGGVLKEFIYLEHGAHYGIGALAMIMLTDIFYPVPEPITGMAGIGFIGLAIWASVRHNKASRLTDVEVA